jgi:hypothetical protein
VIVVVVVVVEKNCCCDTVESLHCEFREIWSDSMPVPHHHGGVVVVVVVDDDNNNTCECWDGGPASGEDVWELPRHLKTHPYANGEDHDEPGDNDEAEPTKKESSSSSKKKQYGGSSDDGSVVVMLLLLLSARRTAVVRNSRKIASSNAPFAIAIDWSGTRREKSRHYYNYSNLDSTCRLGPEPVDAASTDDDSSS